MEPTEAKPRRYGTRNGQVLVFAAVAIILMILLAALAVDVGSIMCTRARLQNAADAGSVAATLELVEQRNELASESSARAAAEAEALAIGAANWDACRAEVIFGIYEDGHFVQKDLATEATAVQVTTYRDDSAPGQQLALFFAPFMGLDAVDVEKHAVSAYEKGIGTMWASLAPFAVHESQIEPPGEVMCFYWPDLIVPGCFGLLNLDGGDLGTPELVDWILNGYDGEIEIPEDGFLWIDGTTGWRAVLKKPLEERLGETVFICVYDEVVGEGSNGSFRIIKFAAVTLLSAKLTGLDPHIEARVQYLVNVPFAETGGPETNLATVKLVE